ncbi:MAG: CBS domain-containing protein [Crocinitomix sp.]|nr:CBS domain-containing protein [Crocinitomix sp.]
MGDHNINKETDDRTRLEFIKHLLDDIAALQQMYEEGKIESGIVRIGAEQEFCLVNENWRPSNKALGVLKAVNDPHFTTELALYNLEINLDPFELKTNAFSKMEKQLKELLELAYKAAAEDDTRIVLTGILPTISKAELKLDFMTPNPRYYALNDRMLELGGSEFRMHLTGVDDLSIKHDSILFEACNTSFQTHLQIEPEDFVSSYNWAQAIAGPVLALSVNAPLLFGRELWNETRIALLQQSIDMRDVSHAMMNQQARVTFGDSWAEGTIIDLFKNEISRYKILISKEIEENSLDVLKDGRTPKLKALNLHNGTIYRWNRPCYGVGNGKAHVRIENRYMPAGPTVIDEMANFAFWVGLMVGRPQAFDNLPEVMDFKDVKLNFIKAARNGSESVMCWMGEEIPLKELVLDKLLPIAHAGLQRMNIDQTDIDRLLNVIKERTVGQTGSQWMVKSYRKLRKKLKRDEALVVLTKSICENQRQNQPVHKWSNDIAIPESNSSASTVGHIMHTRLLTILENDLAELTLRIMQWKNIHHLPIVDTNDNLVGLLTWTHLQHLSKNAPEDINLLPVSGIMVKEVLTVNTSTGIQEAISLMKENSIGCLPVVEKGKLVGIVTVKNLLQFDHE